MNALLTDRDKHKKIKKNPRYYYRSVQYYRIVIHNEEVSTHEGYLPKGSSNNFKFVSRSPDLAITKFYSGKFGYSFLPLPAILLSWYLFHETQSISRTPKDGKARITFYASWVLNAQLRIIYTTTI